MTDDAASAPGPLVADAGNPHGAPRGLTGGVSTWYSKGNLSYFPRVVAYAYGVADIAGRRAGRDATLVDIAVYAGPDRLHPIGKNPQRACEYCGSCLLGCHVHAKNTLDFTYLALAERSGAEIFPLHAVDRIEPAERGYRVLFRRAVDGAPADTAAGEVRGTRVIVAAGALGTTELLLRCRDQHQTLPRLGRALGTGFSGNGDLLVPGAIDSVDHAGRMTA